MVAGVIPLHTPKTVAGVRVGTAAAGIKRTDRDDVVLFELSHGCVCAAVFTRNAFCAAPVVVTRRHLRHGAPRYFLVNSGNANAGMGEQGIADALATCGIVANLAGCATEQVLTFSTGVIGQPLPVDKFRDAVPRALSALDTDGWTAAARAIMTTDTVPKLKTVTVVPIGGRPITITGIAKGAGMIRPDMATMLSFIATDASVEPAVLQELLETAVNASFNRITVDGDTSPNDACLLVATGHSKAARIATTASEVGAVLQAALNEVCRFLAEAIVRDGEGASKFIRVIVAGGRTETECLAVAYTVAHSPLVKTALFASDANWGRILAAVGRAGVGDLDLVKVTVDLNDVRIVEGGGRAAGYTEEAGQAAVQPTDIAVRVNLGRGRAQAEVMTCDLSFDYVRINAEYRT
ncbi:MAG: bifunctional glutamate N-acetyltransferase/amino-acid acetyltransferase ArgJ [Chromatiales bacterium]